MPLHRLPTRMATGDAPGGSDLLAAWNGNEMIVWNGGLPSYIDVNGSIFTTATLRAVGRPATLGAAGNGFRVYGITALLRDSGS